LTQVYDLINDDLDYLDSDKDFIQDQPHRRQEQKFKAVSDDNTAIQEWIYDAYIMNPKPHSVMPNIWDPKLLVHLRSN